jgi:hypothetical protein
MDKPLLPVVGEFTAQCGRTVRVRAATLGQSLAMQKSSEGGNAAALEGLAAFVNACAEMDGFSSPSDVLTSADCTQVVKLATEGGSADFPSRP